MVLNTAPPAMQHRCRKPELYEQAGWAASIAKHKPCTTIGLSMDGASSWQITVAPGGQITLARFALDPQRVFDDPRINVWRDLPERQNAYLERPAGTDGPARLHVKRYKPPHGPEAAAEARAIGLLHEHGIPTVP